MLPQLNPNTDLGAAGVRAYAARAGLDPQTFVRERFGDPLTPDKAGAAIVELLSTPRDRAPAEVMLSGKGMQAIEGS